MIGGSHLADEALRLVEAWIPADEYDHERKYQADLQEFLDRELNTGRGRDIPVTTEHGRSYCDVVVDDRVGIELKRDLSNSQTKKLDGQINAHRKVYDHVIVCACGIEDMDGWRRVKNEYAGRGMDMGMGLEPAQTPISFVYKEKPHGVDQSTPSRSMARSSQASFRERQATPAAMPEQDVDLGSIVEEGLEGIRTLSSDSDEDTEIDTGEAIIATIQFVLVMVVLLIVFALIFTTLF